eukprot:GDKK01010782.1.p1 GENE.GDKK01010782.1~~GDKK01010782.1.p1  ORF type:complete len:513 (+),score=138.31 GDKK01010782.1:34-1539(+)
MNDMKKSPFNLIIYPLFLLGVIVLLAVREADFISVRLKEPVKDEHITILTSSFTKYDTQDVMQHLIGAPFAELSKNQEKLAIFLNSVGANDLANTIREFSIPALPNVLNGASEYFKDVSKNSMGKASEKVMEKIKENSATAVKLANDLSLDDIKKAKAQLEKNLTDLKKFADANIPQDMRDKIEQITGDVNNLDSITKAADQKMTEMRQKMESMSGLNMKDVKETMENVWNEMGEKSAGMFDRFFDKTKSKSVLSEETAVARRRLLVDVTSMTEGFKANLKNFMDSDLKKLAQNPGSYTLSSSNSLVGDHAVSSAGRLSYASVICAVLAFTLAGAPVKFKTVRLVNNIISMCLVVAACVMMAVSLALLSSWSKQLCGDKAPEACALESTFHTTPVVITALNLALLLAMSIWVFVRVWLRQSKRERENAQLLDVKDAVLEKGKKPFNKSDNKKETQKKKKNASEEEDNTAKKTFKKKTGDDSAINDDSFSGTGRMKKNLLKA